MLGWSLRLVKKCLGYKVPHKEDAKKRLLVWFVCVSEAFTSSTPAVKFWLQVEFEEKIVGDINYLINKTSLFLSVAEKAKHQF